MLPRSGKMTDRPSPAGLARHNPDPDWAFPRADISAAKRGRPAGGPRPPASLRIPWSNRMTTANEYEPPKVWTWNKANGGRFANINRPIAGPTHDKELPVGRHPLQLYSLATPNGQKVTIMLEELLALGHKDAEYDAWLIRIGEGEQYGSGFVAVNPNSKIPALVDRSGPTPIRVFETGAILMYLAEKFGEFLPTEPGARAECLSWLFWQMGSAPYLGGGFGHFYAYAPIKIEYAIDRFTMGRSASSMCSIAAWRRASMSLATPTRSRTWPSFPGTA